MDDREAHEFFYKNPEHLRPAGPWAYRRVRPGLKSLAYEPPEHGPRTQTVNQGSLPYWQKNPDYEG